MISQGLSIHVRVHVHMTVACHIHVSVPLAYFSSNFPSVSCMGIMTDCMSLFVCVGMIVWAFFLPTILVYNAHACLSMYLHSAMHM